MSTTLERIALWTSQLKFEDIPPRVLDKAKLQILSMVAAVYSGYPTRAARSIREVVLSSRAQGRALVLPGGDRTSPTVAAMANAAASMALEYDDYLFMGHTGHSAVLASLALAQEEGLGGKDWLKAQIVANEVGGRLGASVMLGPQSGQLWTHIHAPAAACAGAVLLGLDEQATAHAMAMALYQPPLAMWPGFLGPDSKLMSAANPTRDGLQAARMAAWGLTGPIDILDVERGFGDHFAYQYLPQMLSGWGQSWVTDSLCFKIHPGCAHIASAVDGILELAGQFQAKHGRQLALADVHGIQVQTTLFGAEMHKLSLASRPERLAPVHVNFSIPLSLGIAIRSGRLSPTELEEGQLEAGAEEILALANKVEVGHDWSLTLEMLEQMNQALPLTDLLRDLDIRQMLAQRGDSGRQLGGLTDLKPRDLLRAAGFLLNRAPQLMREVGRAARNGLGRIGSQEEAPCDLGHARFDQATMPFICEVNLKTQDKEELKTRVDIPLGAAGRDAAETRGLVRKKFREQAGRLLGEMQVEQALELVDNLEEQQDLDALGQALTL